MTPGSPCPVMPGQYFYHTHVVRPLGSRRDFTPHISSTLWSSLGVIQGQQHTQKHAAFTSEQREETQSNPDGGDFLNRLPYIYTQHRGYHASLLWVAQDRSRGATKRTSSSVSKGARAFPVGACASQRPNPCAALALAVHQIRHGTA